MAEHASDLQRAFKVIQKLEGELAALRQRRAEPIAIVGMACRFPGANGLDEFWSLLSEGRDAITEVPADRWDIDALYDPDPDAPGKMCTRMGGFVSDVDKFDAAFFNIAPLEAALMDPQQRLLLELTWSALEHAAIAPDTLEGSPTGVFVAITGADYCRMAASDPQTLNAYWGTGNAPSVAAGRIAYTFGLTGPCLAIDTACSSSLVAVHSAAESLRRGECTTALAAGANLMLSPEATVAFSKARMMSPDGHCKTFDERANGYVRSEGVAVLVLKTLSRARADGDRVHAVIRGSAINQDGATSGLTVPSGPSQAALIRQALANAGVEPREVGYVEAHGTGTALGDPIEVGALGEVFGRSHGPGQPLYIGSVKTLVGHTELAAGMAGLIKLVLALGHGVIPGYPQLGKLNAHIPWQRLPFAIARETMPWPVAQRRIAGISSFGFSGTNAHLVVEAAPLEEAAPASVPAQPLHLLCLSARSEASLRALAGRYAEHLGRMPAPDIDAVCRTAAAGRAHLPHRIALSASTTAELAGKLAGIAGGAPAMLGGTAPVTAPRVAFLFAGQGAQYAGMGQRLYGLQPVFRQAIDRCEEALAAELDRPLRELLWGAAADRLSETRYTQPALFALEYALAQLWLSWGVRPSFVVGHSIGEFAAACLAGVFSLQDAARLVAARGRLMQALPDGGAMAAIAAPRELVASELAAMAGRVSIAAFNSPTQTVVSGERAAVQAICARMAAQHGVPDPGLLQVSHAFHSPLMRPMLDDFRKVAESVSFSRPAIGFVSALAGRLVDDEICGADYWVAHVSAPVDFVAGMASLAGQGAGIALEIGPGTTLTGLVRATLGDSPMHRLNSLRRNSDDWKEILAALGRLYIAGAAIDWRRAGRLDQPAPARLALPDYPFERRRHWLPEASGGTIAGRPAAGAGRGHPLLGAAVATAALPATDVLYQSALSARRPGFLNDHQVYGRVVVPAAAYVDMALSAAAALHPELAPGVANLSIQAALVVTRERSTVVQTVLAQGAAGARHGLRIFSNAASGDGAPVDWRLHVAGEIDSAAAQPPASVDLPALRARLAEAGEDLDVEGFYAGYAALGLDYGPAFRTVRAVARIAAGGDGGESLARVAREAAAAADAGHLVHPALLDGCFQAVGAIFSRLAGGAAYLPVAIERLRLHGPMPDAVWSHAVLRKPAEGSARVVVDIRLVADDGQVVASVDGLEAVPVDRRALILATASWKDKLYAVDWVLQPRRQVAADGQEAAGTLAPDAGWLVIADQGGVGAALAEALQARGQHVVRTRPNEADRMTRGDWQQLLSRQFGARGVPLAGVVHLGAADAVDSDAPAALEQAEATVCGSTLGLVQALMDTPGQRPPRLWLVTKQAQAVDGQGPAHLVQSLLWGFARTIAMEYPALQCTCIDLPAHETGLPGSLLDDIAQPEAEPQIAYRQGRRHVARLRGIKSLQGQGQLALPEGAFRLRAANYGAFDQLALLPCERAAPAEGEVELEVRAAALNFKDVLFCLGMLRDFSERNGITSAPEQPLGFECAGRVVRVGAGVTDLAVGDDVFAMAPSAMASHVTVARRLVHRKPAGLSFASAAALPTVFMTAVYSLERLAKIRPGDRVLVHACAGGVGQAALQIARRAGAIVYGTASPGKWRMLKDQGVAHVMHSRNLDFADEIMRMTQGRGVDIVLNSLNGEFIEKSASVLAPGGRFVEIGKIGIWSTERMAALRPDIAYASFDLGEIDDTGGRLQAELLGDVVRSFEAGELQPLPVKVFPITRAEAGFRYLAQASNIGKVVFSVPEPDQAADAAIRPDRSYLVTGGLGALGREIAARLVADGARHLVLAGRSAHAADAPIADLPEGVRIHVWPMDVADPVSVAAVIARIGRELPPLGGVVHAAGVLDDATIANQSWARFRQVLAAKAEGAWHLHRATEGMKLRFFVLFSSIASITGSPGQSNYAAANAYLDGLARLRHAQGLPATCINWGPWDKDGMAERAREANRARFAAMGLGRLSVADNLDAFSFLLGSDIPAALVADIQWSRFLSTLPDPEGAALYALVERGAARATAGEAGALRKQLQEAAPEARAATLAQALRAQVAAVIGLESPAMVDLDQPLRNLGFDSLMTVELKNRIESGLRCTLNPSSLIDHPTLGKLSAYLVEMVFGTGAAEAPTTTADGPVSRTALARMTETVIEADGRRIGLCRWGKAGSGPLVVAVHGILDQGAIWDGVADGLCEAGVEVLAPDLRGHGTSSHPAAGANLTVLDFAADLDEVLRREAPGRRVLLMGHSIGSVVAASYALQHPGRVAHLVLVEPVSPRRYRDGDAHPLPEAAAQPVHPDLASAARMLALYHPKLDQATLLALARRITREVEGGLAWTWDPRLRNWINFDLLRGQPDYPAMLARLQVPSTRIYGAASDLAGTPAQVPPGLVLPRSETFTIAGGGHNLHTDAPQALLERLVATLKTLTAE